MVLKREMPLSGDADAYGRDIHAHEELARACAAGDDAKRWTQKIDSFSFFFGGIAAASATWWILNGKR